MTKKKVVLETDIQWILHWLESTLARSAGSDAADEVYDLITDTCCEVSDVLYKNLKEVE